MYERLNWVNVRLVEDVPNLEEAVVVLETL